MYLVVMPEVAKLKLLIKEIEIVDKRDVIVQLRATKISIVESFKDFLIELTGLKY